jgi:hypothetical protein
VHARSSQLDILICAVFPIHALFKDVPGNCYYLRFILKLHEATVTLRNVIHVHRTCFYFIHTAIKALLCPYVKAEEEEKIRRGERKKGGKTREQKKRKLSKIKWPYIRPRKKGKERERRKK